MIDTLRHDVRYAIRAFLHAPGFVALAVLTMAIGVGANSAIFSIVDQVLLRPLPFSDPDSLVQVAHTNRQTKQSAGDASPANFLDWRARNRSFTSLAAYRDTSYTLTTGGDPERMTGALVNANFFDALGVAAARGRTFHAGEEGPEAPRVAILSDGLWKQRFGASADVIGHVVRLDGEPHTIIGVMPPAIDFPDDARIWTTPHWLVPDDPLAPKDNAALERSHGYIFVLGRLKAGVSRAAAQADMDGVAASLERDYPNDNQNVGVAITSLREELVGDVRPTLLLLFAAVGVLLLIATANVSGLLIARATARQQEMSLRIALGATRRRIVAQLLTESVLLAMAGGACGLLLAMWMVAPLAAIGASAVGVPADVHLDVRVLLFALAVSTAAGIVFGLAPARHLVDLTLHDTLKQSARGSTGRRQRRAHAALITAEIAAAVVLLVGAGLTIRSFVRLQRVPTGFDPDRVVTVVVGLPDARYPTSGQKAAFWQRAVESLRAIPGVEAASATSRLPLSGGNSTRGLMVDGRMVTPAPVVDYRTASPDYFHTIGIPLLRGRGFREDDREQRPLVAVISASMAKQVFPGVDPIGHHVTINTDPIAIVGIVGDVHHASLEAMPRPTMYVPYRQDPWPFMTLVLKLAPSPTTAADARSSGHQPAIRQAIWAIDKEQPLGAIRTMDEQLSRSLARRRFSVTLLTAFGVIAVSLAAIGLYGVLAFVVAQRRREIGVRMALGARPRDVVADVLGQGMRLAAVGVIVGIALAVAATRLINSLLFGTSPTDAATFVAVAALLVVITAVASLVPALRASRVEPLVALREE
jgi:putative ABC transport system permease protein